MDAHAPARHLVHHALQHPPGPLELRLARRRHRDIFAHRHGPRHLLHHPHRPPPRVPPPPGGAVQARPVLHGRRLAGLVRERHLHRVDALRLRRLRPTDVSPRDEGQHELRRGHHGRHRPSIPVRTMRPVRPCLPLT